MKKFFKICGLSILVCSYLGAEKNQITDSVFMVSPDTFGFNFETATTNSFQKKYENNDNVGELSLAEFNSVVEKMQACGIRVIKAQSREDIITPDAVFPKNKRTLLKNHRPFCRLV